MNASRRIGSATGWLALALLSTIAVVAFAAGFGAYMNAASSSAYRVTPAVFLGLLFGSGFIAIPLGSAVVFGVIGALVAFAVGWLARRSRPAAVRAGLVAGFILAMIGFAWGLVPVMNQIAIYGYGY